MTSTATLSILFGIIVIAKLLGGAAQKIKIPSVLVEMLIGIVIGNLGLVDLQSPLIHSFSELGVLLLMFLAGLETDLAAMKRSGKEAVSVATLGVIAPMALAFFTLPLIGVNDFNRKIFLAATLTATSVGITVRVLRDVKKLSSASGQVILGAAVLDDIFGILILAMVSSLVSQGTFSIFTGAWVLIKAILFVAALGWMRVSLFKKAFRTIRPLAMSGTVTIIAFSLCLFSAWIAENIGLAGILGAFALGVALDDVHFSGFQEVETLKIEDLMKPISDIFVPVFFIVMGMSVDLKAVLNSGAIQLSFLLIVCAILGKLACSFAVWRPNVDRWLVGFGMLPRGEVGIIFAALGLKLGVFNSTDYSALIIMVFVTTFLAPSLLAYRGREKSAQNI